MFEAEQAGGERQGAAPVLIVTPWYRPSVGGVAEIAERLHTGLTEAGVTAHLLVKGGSWEPTPIPGVPRAIRMRIPGYAFVASSPRNLLAMAWRGAFTYRRLLRYVRAHNIRTVFVLYPIDHSWPFPLLRRKTGCRLIPVLQGNDVESFTSFPTAHRWLLRKVLRSADMVVACAAHLGETARRIAGRDLTVHVIPNCVDIRHFTPAPASREARASARRNLVHISNFAPKKRTQDIITAFARADVPAGTRLVMVGAGPTFDETRRLATELGVDDRVDFVGAQADVRPFLWSADAFVLASESEGAPLVLTETMACGVPFISTAWGAAADAPAGECGIVVPARDPDALAAAIGTMMHDDALRTAMARRCRHFAEQNYSRDTYVERHLALLAAEPAPQGGR